MGWFLFPTNDFASLPIDACFDGQSAGHLTCTSVSLDANKRYYIAVIEFANTPGGYLITVQKGKSEGSVHTPVALTIDTPRSSGADLFGASYYLFTPGASGIYTVSLGNSASVGAYVYADPGFTGASTMCGPAVNLQCPFMGHANMPYYISTYPLAGTNATYDIAVHQYNAANRIYTSTDVPKDIPDNDVATGAFSAITVSDGPASITSVTVSLDITHEYDGDLDIYLEAPDGTVIELSTDNGGAGDNYAGMLFADGAPAAIAGGSAPFTGIYAPEAALSGLSGKNSDGIWTLHVYDDVAGLVGMLTRWSMAIQ